MAKDTILLHHTDDPSPDPQFAKVNAYHKSLGFPKSKLGFYGGYHVFIGKNGTVKQFREYDEVGAHAVNCGCKTDKSGHKPGTINQYAIGVCLAGDFTKQLPTAPQLRALTLLLIDLQQRFRIPDSRVFLHRDVKATSCPGVDLRGLYLADRVTHWREEAAELRVQIAKATGSKKRQLERKLARLESVLP